MLFKEKEAEVHHHGLSYLQHLANCQGERPLSLNRSLSRRCSLALQFAKITDMSNDAE